MSLILVLVLHVLIGFTDREFDVRLERQPTKGQWFGRHHFGSVSCIVCKSLSRLLICPACLS